MEYFEKAKAIWQNEVPKQGQSETVHGELIRSIEKLRDEAQRNGNGNRDEGHSIMLAYLAEVLLNHTNFTDEQIFEIQEALLKLKDPSQVVTEDTPYDFLTERVIDHHMLVGKLPRKKNPNT